MHLNDALGHQEGLTCIYNHHEQACAIAAESYARIHNKIAAVCVTTGPGGSNAITGVLGGYLDSIPMLILSGQVRYDTTARSTGLQIRAMGDQEFDIVKAVGCMTKYSEMVVDAKRIRYSLEKALYIAQHGRPGPCWLDIPLNIQGAYIETDDLEGYDPKDYEKELPPPVGQETVATILQKVKEAKRPVFYAGNGILHLRRVRRLPPGGGKAGHPSGHRLEQHRRYVRRPSLVCRPGRHHGGRAGNFAVQNSDLVLSIGSRLSIRQVGYNYQTWAREAYVIMEDVDAEELKKPTLHVDLPASCRREGPARKAGCGSSRRGTPVSWA